MSELRWTLLILGVVFIAVLSWWERRRPRQAFAPRLRAASPPKSSGAPPPGEPWIGETTLSDVVLSDAALAGAAERREPGAGGRSPAELPAPLAALPTLVIPDRFPAPPPSSMRVSEDAVWLEPPPPEPTLIDPQAIAIEEQPARAAQPQAPEPAPEIAGAEGVGHARVIESALPSAGSVPGEPIVDWPPEESRRILALRVVAPPTERFPGRTLRLALAAEGFLLGKFSIFHKPDETNRAILSAASLTRPGAFDLETMDAQRYVGLSLFAVLPGSKTPPQAFEDLLAAARNLNERLHGALQDERGSPLTTLRVASLRESLGAESATIRAACGE
ncbi:MAG: cell division protein ZipA C-terminal FtsZ-binding domain-containing protein [Steroidobacteraceae bacterium]